jgi:triosephosphate isomerase
MARRAIVAANWKMNGGLALINTIVDGLTSVELQENVDIVICPSFPFLSEFVSQAKVNKLDEAIHVGAQNVSAHESGAYTGEISTQMLQELSVEFVIIAHKVNAALKAGLTPILCIGESEDERVAEQTETVLASQLQPVIDEVGIEKFIDVVIAYEPVWAIGTGKTASSEMAQETHKFIRQFLAKANASVATKVPLLYGGSVNASNCEELFAQTDIDGGLIGGASLQVEQFIKICSAAKGK